MSIDFPRKPLKWSKNKELRLYAIDWIECDENIPYIQVDGDEYKPKVLRPHDKKYTIFGFGVTQEGYSVCLKVVNYNPYFFLKIPDEWSDEEIKEFQREFLDREEIWDEDEIYDKIDDMRENYDTNWYPKNTQEKIKCRNFKSSIIPRKTQIIEKEIFWTFTNNQKYKFWKVYFNSKSGAKLYHSFLKDEQHYECMHLKKNPDGLKQKFKLFESDLEPLLRFFHDSKIKPSDWISIPANTYRIKNGMSSTQINIEVDWSQIKLLDKSGIPPLIVASFDIEADSSHGDFPVPKKDCKKLANELVICYLRDKHTMEKNPKKSLKYQEADKKLQQRTEYFRNRILQALGLDFIGENDEDISKVFFKNRNNLDFISRSKSFDAVCKEIHYICNRPVRKVKANQQMKAAINKVNAIFEKMTENYKSNNQKKGSCGLKINDLINLIRRVAKQDNIIFNDLRDKMMTKEVLVKFVNKQLNTILPAVKGDQVIQIGTVFWRFGDDKPIHNHIITLKGCDKIPNVEEVIPVMKEKQVLNEWTKMIKEYDPDVILGYNIFGFDETFMYERALDLNPKASRDPKSSESFQKFINIGRLSPETCKNIPSCQGKLINKKLSSSALGDNYLYYFNMPGRVQIDLLKVIQGDATKKLPSYKLDSVAETFISGKVIDVGHPNEKSNEEDIIQESNWIKVKYATELNIGNYMVINMKTGEQFKGGQKLFIDDISYQDCTKNDGYVKLRDVINRKILTESPEWGLAKDDVSPKDIFRLQKGNDSDRAIIAKYCIQDCALVIRLLKKLQTIPNNFGMSNVCLVPFSYIFMRGQGIKIFSLVVNECNQNGYLLPVLEKRVAEEEEEEEEEKEFDHKTDTINYTTPLSLEPDEEENSGEMKFSDDFNVINMNDDGYEGAIVLKPKPGIYIGEPITVLDFSSLYPSEMIASNLSHDSHCENDYWLGDKGAERIIELGHTYKDITYDVFGWIDPDNHNKGKHKIGETTERFVQYADGRKGLLPTILRKLLGARKATKKLMKAEPDPFKAVILDGLQLAYKVTANSLYGQTGARTSKIYKKSIAASTTAGGRRCIYRAKDYVLKNNPGCDVVYGDTDSVFVKFNLVYDDGTYPTGYKEKIQRSMDVGLAIQQKLKDDKYFDPPHDLEYEKVFDPLMLITKKRYGGEKYEFDINNSKFTSMGIVLKRRDNAPILKYVYQGVMNMIMKERNIIKAVEFVKQGCRDLLDDKFDLNMFVISKTLRDYYKDPESIAHKVLADRMAERDPGNKPASNERIPYAYIQVEQKKGVDLLQGDKIEHINYIRENKCKIDYLTYLNNQLLKPICQVFELVVEQIKGYPYQSGHFEELYIHYYNKFNGDEKKTNSKVSELKQKVVAKLIFQPFLLEAYNKQNNIRTLDSWLTIEKIDKLIDDVLTNEDEELVEDEKSDPLNKKHVVVSGKKMKQLNISSFCQKKDDNSKQIKKGKKKRPATKECRNGSKKTYNKDITSFLS